MKSISAMIILSLLTSMAVAKEQSLFNGNDLTNWDGAPGWWYVEDGAITSESTLEKPCTRATYLVWQGGEPSDFELSLDFKISPNSPKANSGVQIRSERRPEWDTFGYQADMDAAGKLVGYVYHHSRGLIAARGQKVTITTEGQREAEQVADSEELKAVFQTGEWNHYRIVCRGPVITLYVNQVLMCEFSDHDPNLARSKGILALQMHPGPPMKVQFKNIVLTTLTEPQSISLEGETALIAVLESAAGVQEKVDACRELARIGTSAAVPALAAVLPHEELSPMARYALESISDPAVDEALREALGVLKGDQLAGVISTIGTRRDVKAVDALSALLASGEPSVAQVAASALGHIGTEGAAEALQAALESEGMIQGAVCDGLLECAETFSASGNKEAAIALYHVLRTFPKASDRVRAAALRGAVVAGGNEGLDLLAESIRSANEVEVQAAMNIAAGLEGSVVASMLSSEMGRVHPSRHAQLAEILGKTGDAEALPTLLALTKAYEPSARMAAIRALAEIGGPGTIPLLMELMKDADNDVAEVAATSLAGLPGAQVDDAIVGILVPSEKGTVTNVMEQMMAEAGDGDVEQSFRIKMVEMVAQRKILSAMPVLAALMNDEDAAMRLAAISSYGELADFSHLPVLLEAIGTSTHADDYAVFGEALAAAYRNDGDPGVVVPQIADSLDQAVDGAKPTLVKLLKMIDGPDALAAVRHLLDDPDPQVQEAAAQALEGWRTPDADPVP